MSFIGQLPKNILRVVRDLTIKKYNTKVSGRIPKTQIQELHLKNTKVLVDRFEMLKLLPQNAVVAEIGVDEGTFSQRIMELAHPKKLHLVDLWADIVKYGKDKEFGVKKHFKKEIENGQIEIHIGYSTDVVDSFPDAYFDWVYIDTDHSYQTTKLELEKYASKIKENGFICGHDFVQGYWEGMVRYGVIEAVYEFCVNYGWEIVYITLEVHHFRSFALRKIRD